MLGEIDNRGPALYFLMRWTPPYHFTLIDVAKTAGADCDQPWQDADALTTLFPRSE